MAGAGTSVGANAWKADEAMSRADFCKGLGVVLKELNETRGPAVGDQVLSDFGSLLSNSLRANPNP